MQGVKIGCVGTGRSFTMAASVDGTGNQKDGKRRTKKERRNMVESFVQKYRSANRGKFPYLCFVHKEVGGDYYIVREIMQEMIHELKASENFDRVDVSGKQTRVYDLKPILVSEEMSVSMSKATGEDVDKNYVVGEDQSKEIFYEPAEGNLDDREDTVSEDWKVTKSSCPSAERLNSLGISEEKQTHELAEESMKLSALSTSLPIEIGCKNAGEDASFQGNMLKDEQLPSVSVDKQQEPMKFEIQAPDFSQNVSIESKSENLKNLTPSIGTEDSNDKTRHATSFSVPEQSEVERLGYKRESTGDDSNSVKLDGDTDGTHRASENLKGSEISQQLQEDTLWGNLKAFTKGVFSFWKRI